MRINTRPSSPPSSPPQLSSPPRGTRRPRRTLFGFLLCVLCVLRGGDFFAGSRVAGQSVKLDPALLGKPPIDAWPTYHGDYSGRRYSTLKQINATNVKNLTLAWVYRLNTSRTGALLGGEGADTPPPISSQIAIKSTPLLLNGILYLSVPAHVWAL